MNKIDGPALIVGLVVGFVLGMIGLSIIRDQPEEFPGMQDLVTVYVTSPSFSDSTMTTDSTWMPTGYPWHWKTRGAVRGVVMFMEPHFDYVLHPFVPDGWSPEVFGNPTLNLDLRNTRPGDVVLVKISDDRTYTVELK